MYIVRILLFGGYWTAEQNWIRAVTRKFGESNITKHLECAHTMKLKQCGVFDCYNKVKLAARLTLKTAAPRQQHLVSFLRHQVTEFVVKFKTIHVKNREKNHQKKSKKEKPQCYSTPRLVTR